MTEKVVLQYFCSLGAAIVLQTLGRKSIAELFSVNFTSNSVSQYFYSLGFAKVLLTLGSKSIAELFFRQFDEKSPAIPLLPRACKTFALPREHTVWKSALKCDHDFLRKVGSFFRQTKTTSLYALFTK